RDVQREFPTVGDVDDHRGARRSEPGGIRREVIGCSGHSEAPSGEVRSRKVRSGEGASAPGESPGWLPGYAGAGAASGGAYVSRCRFASSVRDVISSLVKMFLRWKSIVRGLKNICAATSRFERPWATRPAM